MTREELLKEIMKLPKVETDNQISTMNSINVDDLMSAVDRLNKVPDYNDLLKENQELKKHLKVPKAYNLKTLEDYKSYYEDTTREQILEDTYIEYCAYVNLAHRYSELKKQLEEYQLQNINLRADIMIQKMAFPNKLIKDKTFYNLYDMSTYEELLVQQKEFINFLEGQIKTSTEVSRLIYKNILQKYKEIIGVSDR